MMLGTPNVRQTWSWGADGSPTTKRAWDDDIGCVINLIITKNKNTVAVVP